MVAMRRDTTHPFFRPRRRARDVEEDMRRTLFITLAAAGTLLAATPAPPAEAATAVFVAYGEGTTACTIEVHKYADDGGIWTGGEDQTMFHGKTDCNAPVEQTGHAVVPKQGFDDNALDGGLCSGKRVACFSGDDGWGIGWGVYNSNPVTYRVSLRAPLGQGWLGAPTHCTGVGTDNLKCEFSITNTDRFV